MSRVLGLLVLLLSLSLGIAAAPARAADCAATPMASPVAAAAFPLTLSDDLGRQVEIRSAPRRIVSLAPSNTEILFALGLAERVVAVDAYSDYPPAAAEKPRVGDYIAPDLEQIVALDPDLVLATAAHEATVLPRLDDFAIAAFVLEPETLDEVLQSIVTVGALTGAEGEATDLVCALERRVAAVERAVAGASPPRVFFELSPDLYTAGESSYVADLIARAGGENIVAADAGPWPQLSAEAVIAADPEVILLADHEAGVTPEVVSERPGWQGISAVREGRVVALESDPVARPGPRVVDGLEAIARALHPERFPEG